MDRAASDDVDTGVDNVKAFVPLPRPIIDLGRQLEVPHGNDDLAGERFDFSIKPVGGLGHGIEAYEVASEPDQEVPSLPVGMCAGRTRSPALGIPGRVAASPASA